MTVAHDSVPDATHLERRRRAPNSLAQIFTTAAGRAVRGHVSGRLCRWCGKPIEIDRDYSIHGRPSKTHAVLRFTRTDSALRRRTSGMAACGRAVCSKTHGDARWVSERHRRLGAQQGFRLDFSAVAGRDSQGDVRNDAETYRDALLAGYITWRGRLPGNVTHRSSCPNSAIATATAAAPTHDAVAEIPMNSTNPHPPGLAPSARPPSLRSLQLPKKTSPGCTSAREFRVILLCPTVLFGAQMAATPSRPADP